MRRTFFVTMVMTLLGFFCGARTTVSIVTISPGDQIYELEGHAALRITDDTSGSDYMFNWGTFDFNAPNFVYRFVKGETDYRLEALPTKLYVDYYSTTGRRMVSQRLDLTDRQVERLCDLVGENMKPENRVYRYNYLLDNCATRPLRLVELALGDTIILGESHEVNDQTFRRAMRRFHSDYPWYQFGIDLALGSGIDRAVTGRELSFAPVNLMKQLDATRIRDISGRDKPLVMSTEVLAEGRRGGVSPGPTPWYLTPWFWAWVVFGAATIVSWRDMTRYRVSRWFDTILYSLFGLSGLLLTFLIFVSTHEATSPNWLYLWLNPLCFIGAIGIWIKKGRRAVYFWQILNFALLMVLCVLALAGVQALNSAFWPLIFSDMMRSATYLYIARCSR